MEARAILGLGLASGVRQWGGREQGRARAVGVMSLSSEPRWGAAPPGSGWVAEGRWAPDWGLHRSYVSLSPSEAGRAL